MEFIAHIRSALANLVAAKLRSFLAILGVLVGTGSVVALISYSQLGTEHVLAQFNALGTNLISVSAMPNTKNNKKASIREVALSDMPLLKSISPDIQLVAPFTVLYQTIYFKGKRMGNQAVGADERFLNIAKVHLERGRMVNSLDKRGDYALVGYKLANKIKHQGLDPIGQVIRLGSHYLQIVGVAKHWPSNMFIFANIDTGVVVPIGDAFKLNKNTKINNLLFRLRKGAPIQEVQKQIEQKFKQLYPDLRTYFSNPEEIIKSISKARKTFAWLLSSIAGISLLVGGIGVMNIMLVSVVERRREIGIRIAIGARRRDILLMFLIEAIILTVFGGVMGIIVGIATAWILSAIAHWSFHLLWLPPILGFAVSVLVGIFSGFYPALRASKLDPIQTLHAD